MKGFIVLIALLGIWHWSSGKEYHLIASNSVPAASGTVKVDREKDNGNGNTKLDIKVDNLAEPSNLTPAASTYIVWVRPNGGAPMKEGALGVGKGLKGQLKVNTVSKNFDLFITAEQSETVAAPSGQEVLHTHIDLS